MGLPDQAEYEPTWKLLGQQPDGTLLQKSENEWVPVTGYINFSEAAHAITDYIVAYYSSLRLHDYTVGYPQTNRKTDTGKTLKQWPVLVDHYKVSF